MTVKRPVSRSLAQAFFSIIMLSVLTSAIALLTLASSQRDAEAINIAGSLRMQSYRLGYEMQRTSPSLAEHRAVWQQTLSAPALQKISRWYVPDNVKQRYHQLHLAWQEMDKRIASGDTAWYQSHIEDFVGRIDAFVLALQHYTEHKIQLVILMSLAGGLGILLLAMTTLRRIRRQVVLPLKNLVAASERIEQRAFDTPAPDTHLPNELGQLSRAFNHMSGELHTLYRSLEHSVAEKTRHLNEAHQQLEMLFTCSQALNTGQIDSHCFRHILQIVHDYTQMNYLELRTSDDWRLAEGTESATVQMQSLPVLMQDTLYGELRWQSDTANVSLPLMKSVATMLGRGLYFNQGQKHFQQLLLMEERATIARELHDSLAQVLSYLRIQLTLLKHAVPEENAPAQTIIADFSRELNNAWQQLRELLTTFRLTLNHANLPAALQESLDGLQSQTQAKLTLDCRLSSLALDAQKQVHLLQIVREAVLNAIKHAEASEITVSCITATDGTHTVTIRDNGIGIGEASEPPGHYGLNIMRERAGRLGGTLSFSQPPNGGTQVSVKFSTPAGK
ncbi:nitrate/nitrite two-component system sensor histidine kinase NarQ [Enterobacter cancerogenus]|uniref:nitrate/nitrite two-component system sensor histidine kinase NarQ n=1 Tax=Enterobacter cancerogenus TaxID=69218 RepID=UPI0007341155|nr:nitrate/nitrite two-component system sensor histidine kinase NarQ [Enterobacter cancerogenus]KTQ46264.1 nitrate/nitrite sensor protein NarQ [Enterobacter cancerogenus]KTQ50658.1 nitrate/nitrite sensor protein NarQ [Enterobacter cancerogenus]KTQ68317.1 nitrate/nitrite sensor protein NarQ [Enterobacter cancerogenus]KTQ81931.1 nitrate/nitrite sensor protein NarQ [Enterobacter cancerogenus]MDT7008920.1 nitrate/nitrite two-component system sensor histidine kinase NarQ [Enterobacter cancerogenus]